MRIGYTHGGKQPHDSMYSSKNAAQSRTWSAQAAKKQAGEHQQLVDAGCGYALIGLRRGRRPYM
jgi:hypothetical protein